jgi:hypothetical protein
VAAIIERGLAAGIRVQRLLDHFYSSGCSGEPRLGRKFASAIGCERYGQISIVGHEALARSDNQKRVAEVGKQAVF